MSGFSVPSGLKDAVDLLVADSAGMQKAGKSAAESDDDFFYGEAKAEELGNFKVNNFLYI